MAGTADPPGLAGVAFAVVVVGRVVARGGISAGALGSGTGAPVGVGSDISPPSPPLGRSTARASAS